MAHEGFTSPLDPSSPSLNVIPQEQLYSSSSSSSFHLVRTTPIDGDGDAEYGTFEWSEKGEERGGERVEQREEEQIEAEEEASGEEGEQAQEEEEEEEEIKPERPSFFNSSSFSLPRSIPTVDINFFVLHLVYFGVMSLIGGFILFFLEREKEENVSFTDAIFTMGSGLCVTGLSVVPIDNLSLPSQILLVCWMQLGGMALLSIVPSIIRLIFLNFRLFGWKNVRVVGELDGLDSSSLESSTLLGQQQQQQQQKKKLKKRDKKKKQEQIQARTVRILWLIIRTVLIYIFSIEIFSILALGWHMTYNEEANETMKKTGVENGWWWSIFLTISGFQNAGFSLRSSSLIPFASDRVIAFFSVLIIASGNTLFPVLLRGVFVLKRRFFTWSVEEQNDLDELLKNPRAYYFMLFDTHNTNVLAIVWVFLTGLEWVVFFIDWNDIAAYDYNDYGAGTKLMINFVQTVAVRSCGNNNVDIGALQSGHLVFLIPFMYLASFPFIITIRSTSRAKMKTTTSSSLRRHRIPFHLQTFVNHIFARDMVCLWIVAMLIAFIEEDQDSTQIDNSFLNIMFEVSSAFGSVGLSTGYPGELYSYSGAFTTWSKILIFGTFFAGRHRGLPTSLDPSVSLSPPDEEDEVIMKGQLSIDTVEYEERNLFLTQGFNSHVGV